LKFKLTILLFVFAHVTHGQSDLTQPKKINADFKRMILGKYYVDIDHSNYLTIYEKVKSLIEFADKDSSYKATKLMWALLLYDTAKYSTDFFKPLLDRIQASNESYYDRMLKGEWRFSHDFWTGLVWKTTTTSAYDTGRTITFKNGYAEFHFYDTLQRKTKYAIIPDSTGFEISRVNNFKILFLDKKEYWTFVIDTKKKIFGDRISLRVILYPNCSCGCGSDIYYKQEEPPYLTTRK
jgi:hypothetical protein